MKDVVRAGIRLPKKVCQIRTHHPEDARRRANHLRDSTAQKTIVLECENAQSGPRISIEWTH